MANNSNQSTGTEYRVGIFVALGLAAVMFTTLMLGGKKALFTKYIVLKAKFTEVQGLFPGSVVSLAGLPVGNVKAIEFSPGENLLVAHLQINQEFADRLVEGSTAEIRTQGALGDKYVYINPGPPEGGKLSDGAEVKGVEVDYIKMLTSREDGVARVIDLIKDLQVLVATMNSGNKMATAVTTFTDTTEQFKKTLIQVSQTLETVRGEIPENKKLRAALINLSNIFEKIDQGKGTLGQLINDPSIHQSLKSWLGSNSRNRFMKEMIKGTMQKSDSVSDGPN